MNKNSKGNSYDQIKGMLNTMRNFDKNSRNRINEQQEPETNFRPNNQQAGQEKKDFIVINNVEVVISSSDEMDFQLSDEEKGKISQVIDDFRTEITEMVDFGKLQIYNNSAKLNGILNQYNINFVLSAGDDQGVFIGNSSLVKITREVLELLSKMENFGYKFNSTIDDVISNRKQN